MEFFFTMPMSSTIPIMLKMFSVVPDHDSASTAPVRLKGSAISTVTGWMKLLNCAARTM